jgi:uncharacterized protein YdeI (YjbR/CyaY-like superfamily)
MINKSVNYQPKLHLDTVTEWTQWLLDNHESSRLVWMRIRKIASKKPGILLSEAVKEAIRFGWIDGQITTIDQDYFYLRFTPRGAKSVWSLINKKRAQTFIDEGTMMPLGLKAVENGKVNHTWQAAYSSSEKPELPQDLKTALQNDPQGQSSFDLWKNTEQLQVIFWISTAKTEEIRQNRIQRILTVLKSGGTLKDLSKKA